MYTAEYRVEPSPDLDHAKREPAVLPAVVLLGKLPPPYLGPAIATRIILRSELNRRFKLHHVDTRAHQSLQSLGKWSVAKSARNIRIYARLAISVWGCKPALVLVPISQTPSGFVKDSIFILIARVLRQRTIVQLRGSNLRNWLAGTNALMRWYVKAVVRQASAAIVLGENLRPLFRGLLPENRIFVVPNGGSYTFPPRTIKREGITRFLYLSNLQRTKGIEDVIHAIAVLSDRGVRGFHLDVVGEWIDLRARTVCLDLAERKALPVSFHGPKYDEDKLPFFSAADVFVFVPRAPEGHPWVVVEAMAAGLPIIATDRGAISESVRDGDNGVITESSPEAIADAMEAFVKDPVLIREMGAASIRHYHEKFTEARMVERLGNVFDAVLNDG